MCYCEVYIPPIYVTVKFTYRPSYAPPPQHTHTKIELRVVLPPPLSIVKLQSFVSHALMSENPLIINDDK